MELSSVVARTAEVGEGFASFLGVQFVRQFSGACVGVWNNLGHALYFHVVFVDVTHLIQFLHAPRAQMNWYIFEISHGPRVRKSFDDGSQSKRGKKWSVPCCVPRFPNLTSSLFFCSQQATVVRQGNALARPTVVREAALVRQANAPAVRPTVVRQGNALARVTVVREAALVRQGNAPAVPVPMTNVRATPERANVERAVSVEVSLVS